MTTLVCFIAVGDWSQYCNGNPADGVVATPAMQLSLQDQEAAGYERTIVKALQIKPSGRGNTIPAIAQSNQTVSQSTVERPEGKPVEATLPEISRLTILHHFGVDENESWKGISLDQLAKKFVVKDEHKKNAGLFITLIKNGDTRACWGSITASHSNLVQATVYTTEDAIIKDYRYSRIKKSEINQLIPQVTVVKRIIPINSIVTMKPLKEGLMVRAGGKGAVLLPGEASDPHYQLVKTKLKAGIPMSQPSQLYKIEADVYR